MAPGAVDRFKKLGSPTGIQKLTSRFTPQRARESLALDALEEVYKQHGFPEFKDLDSARPIEELKAEAFATLAGEPRETVKVLKERLGRLAAFDILISALKNGDSRVKTSAEDLDGELRKAIETGQLGKDDVPIALKLRYEFRNHSARTKSYSDLTTRYTILKTLSTLHGADSHEHNARLGHATRELGEHHEHLGVSVAKRARDAVGVLGGGVDSRRKKELDRAIEAYKTAMSEQKTAGRYFKEAAGSYEKAEHPNRSAALDSAETTEKYFQISQDACNRIIKFMQEKDRASGGDTRKTL